MMNDIIHHNIIKDISNRIYPTLIFLFPYNRV